MIINTIKLNRELTATKTQLQSEIDARALVEKDLKEAQDTIGNFMEEKSKMEATIKELEAKTVITEKVINNKVNIELANIGVEKGMVPENSLVAALSPADALREYQALTGKASTEYYAKHEQLILTAISRQHNPKFMTDNTVNKNTIKL